jgi:hypothetical protein
MMVAASNLPAQELTTFSHNILWHENVVNIFPNAEFTGSRGDYTVVKFTTYPQPMLPCLLMGARLDEAGAEVFGEVGHDSGREMASWR